MFGFFRKRPSEPEGPSEPPISDGDLRELFEYLDRPDPPPCTHSHRETTEFLQGRNIPVGEEKGMSTYLTSWTPKRFYR